jgi:hypothetical protein
MTSCVRASRPSLLLVLAALLSTAMAQPSAAWEYLVVSYATPTSGAPRSELGGGEASRSKVLRFADLGIPLPASATELQRNIDLLGRFGWELAAVVDSAEDGQQLIFKRPYDQVRSEREAQRIAAERAAILAEFDSVRELPRVADVSELELVDLDAVDRARATVDRNVRDAAGVRARILDVLEMGYPIAHLEVDARAQSPSAPADVVVRLTQDVTNAALVGATEYRSSLALGAYAELLAALAQVGLAASTSAFCIEDQGVGTGRVLLTVDLAIRVDGTATVVATRRSTHCFVEA